MAKIQDVIPVKKLMDKTGNYYPLSSTESVVTPEEIRISNNIGGYNAGTVIPKSTLLSQILKNILAVKSTAPTNVVIDFNNASNDTVPSSLLVETHLTQLDEKIDGISTDKQVQIDDINNIINNELDSVVSCEDQEDCYLTRIVQEKGRLSDVNYGFKKLPDKSKVVLSDIKENGDTICTITIDGEPFEIKQWAITGIDQVSEDTLLSSSVIKSELDKKQAVIVWKNSNYNPETNKAVTVSDLDEFAIDSVHYVGEVINLSNVTNPRNGDIALSNNVVYIYKKSDLTWFPLNINDIYTIKGQIKDSDISSDAKINPSKISGLVEFLNKVDTKSTVSISAKNVSGDVVEIATVSINGVVTSIKAPVGGTVCQDSSVRNGNIVVFSDTTGKRVRDGGFKVECDVPQNAKFTDTTYSLVSDSADGLMSKEDKGILDNLKTTVASNVAKIEELQDGVPGTAQDIENLRVQVTNNTQSITGLQTQTLDLDTNKADKTQLSEFETRVNNRMDSVEAITDSTVRQFGELDSKVDEFDVRITANTQDIELKQNKLEFLTPYDKDTNKVATQKDIERLTGPTYFLGITTTALTDGSKTATININGKNVTAEGGDIAIYNNIEFLYVDEETGWQKFGTSDVYIIKGTKSIVNDDISDTAQISQTKINGLVAALNSKADADNVLMLSTDQNIGGMKTFTHNYGIGTKGITYTDDDGFSINYKDSAGNVIPIMIFSGKTVKFNETVITANNPVQGIFSSALYS